MNENISNCNDGAIDCSDLSKEPSGIYQRLSYEAYDLAPGLRSGDLNRLLKSPLHYAAQLINTEEKKSTPAMEFGKLFHELVLYPEARGKIRVQPQVDSRTKVGRMKLEEFQANLEPDSVVVPAKDYDRTMHMLEALLKHPAAGEVLSNGTPEVSYFWKDDGDDLLQKARFDFLRSDGLIVDLKTTSDAGSWAFARSIYSYGYYVQASHYLAAQSHNLKRTADEFCFVAIESSYPYAVAVYSAGIALISKGDEDRQRALQIYRNAKKKNYFEGYGDQIMEIDLPAYAYL